MTEVELYAPREPDGLALLRDTAAALSSAHQIATALVRTGFVPPQYRGKPEEAAAAMLAGAEVGLSPLAALRSFDSIQGVAMPRAQTLRAVAQAHGHEVWVEEASDQRAVVCGQRRGSQQVERVTWTMDRARRAGLAGKGTWQQHPEAMLVARATAEVCRRIASDAILGLGFAAEERDDPAPVTTVQRATPPPGPVTVRRAPAPAPEPGPEPPADPPPVDAPPGVTAAQLRKLGAGMREHGITDRTEALAFVADVIGRDIASRNELTRDEASVVIDELDRLAAEDAGSGPTPAGDDPRTGPGDAAASPGPLEPPLPDPADGADPWTGGDRP
jgi:hypothetical protein